MMSMSGKVRMSYYEELGDKFEVYMSDYDVERRVNLMFSVLIDPDQIRGRRVLEIGSGTGRISSVVVRVGGELTILDVGPRLVSEVVGALNCEGMAADAQKLAIGDDLFDLVFFDDYRNTLTGTFSGGDPDPAICQNDIGIATLRIYTQDGCYEDTINVTSVERGPGVWDYDVDFETDKRGQ